MTLQSGTRIGAQHRASGVNVVPVPLRLLIDDFARTNGVGDFGEVANVGIRITVEHEDIGVKSLLYSSLPRGLEVGGRVGCQRSKHFAKRQSTPHKFKLERRIVEVCKANICAEENDTSVGRKGLELIDARLDQIILCSLVANNCRPK